MVEPNNLNGKVLQALIDFDLIVNTDVGLIRFIREKFQDDRAFILDILNKSDREILSLLYSRKNPNPLSIISTEANMSDIDELYNSFFDKYKKEIIRRSVSEQNIIDFVKLVIASGQNFGVNGYIAVNDELEENEIYSHFSRIGIVKKSNKSSIINKEPYYVKDFRFFKGIEDKVINTRIYVAPYQYNIDYLESVDNLLTSMNQYILFGKDHRINQGEK